MTETQLIAYAAPLIIYIMAAAAIAITAFLYLELKEKKARFKNFYRQQQVIDDLKDENKALLLIKDKITNDVTTKVRAELRAELKSVRI